MTKMMTCLWFDRGKAREAAEFYASVSPTATSGKLTPPLWTFRLRRWARISPSSSLSWAGRTSA